MSLIEALAATEGPPDRAADLVADRSEVKFLVGAADVPSLALGLGARLSAARGAREQELTTIYFDTARCELYRAALSQPIAVKVRIRSYRVADAGAAPFEDAAAQGTGVFVELKVREGERSRKRRVQLPMDAALSLIERPDRPALHGCDVADRSAVEVVADELMRLRGRIGPLRASCAVRYLRVALEEPALALRVTIDRELCAFPQGRGLLPPAHERREAGLPVFVEPACVVEVKSRASWPAWLAPLLSAHGARPTHYSKFVVASRAVHGLVR